MKLVGPRANLGDADLHGADLHGAYLRGANLRGANLRGANLGGANLGGAYLHGADLRDADLGGANLGDANLGGAYLHSANLGGADLRGANLRGANLRGACYSSGTNWPAPTMLLLAAWGSVTPALCTALMRLDAACHPRPAAFSVWARGGKCPYDGVVFERAANFHEMRRYWSPGPVPRPWSLVRRLLKQYLRKEA
jgi:hypothetical protein